MCVATGNAHGGTVGRCSDATVTRSQCLVHVHERHDDRMTEGGTQGVLLMAERVQQ